MLTIPQLETFCFIFSTEVGSKIWGWTTMLSSILGIIVFSTEMLFRMESNSGNMEDLFMPFMIFRSYIVFLFSAYLLVGITNRNMRYVYRSVIFFILNHILSAALTINGILGPNRNPVHILEIPVLILNGYFILLVYSYYMENKLCDEMDEEMQLSTFPTPPPPYEF